MEEKSSFDTIAEKYDSSLPSYVVRHYLRKRVDFIKKHAGGKVLLDVGCGTGLLAQSLEKEGFEVSGLDPSEKMLDIARRRFAGRMVKGPSYSIPFDDNTFDTVVSVAVFHHIADKDKVLRSINEMVRVSKKGGAIIIWDHNPLNPYWPIIMKKVPQDTGCERLIPLRELREGLIKCGVSQIKIYRKGFIPEFIPEWALPFFRVLESILEKISFICGFLLAHNVVLCYK